MIAPEHISSGAPHDRSATEGTRTDRVVDVDAARRGASVDDTATSPDDIPIRTTSDADESGYPAAPANDEQRPAETTSDLSNGSPTRHIRVDDGHVIAIVDPALTDAAADVLWRIVEKAMRKDETG
jgi:hypothetical protein